MSLTKKQIRIRIGILLDEECANCEKKKNANKHKIDGHLFQNYCIHECPLGKELQQLGASLESETGPRRGQTTVEKALRIKETLQRMSN